MTTESLKIFCDLVESQSFTKAALINGVTQSAVSQQITGLEKTFRSLLIERSKKQFRLTREGQVLYDYSKQITQTHDLLCSKIQELQDRISGTIQIASIYSIGLHELPPYLKNFMINHPTVNVRVEYRRSQQVYEDVLGNTVDLGFIAYPEKNSKLEFVPFGQAPLVIICQPRHPFARQTAIKLMALSGQNFVGFEPDIPTRKAIDKILRAHHVHVNYVVELDNIETLKRAVEIDAGIAIVPLAAVQQEIAQKSLVAVKIEDGEFFRPIAAIYKQSRVLTPVLKEFLATLQQPLD